MPHRQREVKLREFAGLLSRRIDELKKPPARESVKLAFRSFADTLPSIIWTAGRDGEVTFFSRRYYEFFGTTDTDWAAIIHPDDKQATTEAWAHSVETGKPYTNTARFRDAAGKYHPILTNAQPALTEDGRVAYWIGSSTVLEMPAVIQQVA